MYINALSSVLNARTGSPTKTPVFILKTANAYVHGEFFVVVFFYNFSLYKICILSIFLIISPLNSFKNTGQKMKGGNIQYIIRTSFRIVVLLFVSA